MKPSDLPADLRAKLGLDSPANKYHVSSKATRTADNITFASKLEMHRYRELVNMKRAGLVKFFLRQVPIHLPGNVRYVLDFLVFHADGRITWEDTKGMRTAMYKLKRKQVQELYPITITEIER